jgi:hypothetical protein
MSSVEKKIAMIKRPCSMLYLKTGSAGAVTWMIWYQADSQTIADWMLVSAIIFTVLTLVDIYPRLFSKRRHPKCWNDFK